MKKILASCVIIISLLVNTAFAQVLEAERVDYKQQIGSLFSAQTSEGKYLVDSENNVLSGPYPQISDFSGFPYAETADGGNIMFDVDGTVLASVEKGGEINPPANGIYIVSPYTDRTDVKSEFIVYDYETKEELFRTDTFFFYYQEQQSEKMFIERDGKFAIIDKNGNYLTDYIYDDVKKRFNPDYEPYPKAYAIVVINGEEKYIDWDLNEINLENYNGERFLTQFYRIKKGFDTFKEYYVAESGDYSAIFDMAAGEYLIPFQNEMSYYAMDENCILAKKNGKTGAVDYNGTEIVPFVYENLLFSEEFGSLCHFVKDGKSGLLDIERNIEVSDFSGTPTENGIMIKNYTDYSTGYKQYCAEIVNYAGHNLTGEVYLEVRYENGNYFYTHSKGDYNDINTPVYFDKNFAIINLNGDYLPFDGTIRDDRTLVPMREIVEGLGGAVTWDEKTRTAKAVIDGRSIEMTIDNNEIKVDGNVQKIDVPAQLINEKTMLPVRALCENLGAEVDWDGKIRCVYITK